MEGRQSHTRSWSYNPGNTALFYWKQGMRNDGDNMSFNLQIKLKQYTVEIDIFLAQRY